MKRVRRRELRNNSGAILRRVRSGETFEVTNHGDVVAYLMPPEQGVELRIIEARVRGRFKDLVLVERPERTEDVLDELRAE